MNFNNGKDPRAGNTGPFENHFTNEFDCPIEMTFGKASSALKVSFASAGHLVHDGSDDDYCVTRANWSMYRNFLDYAALTVFGRQLGVINHG